MSIKIYTEENNKKHKMIIALKKKGFTGICVQRRSSNDYHGRGIFLECNEISYLKLGNDLKDALITIVKLIS